MFTKFVVAVASVRSSAPETPSPTAFSIAPGSSDPAARAASVPSGMIHTLVTASAVNTAAAMGAAAISNSYGAGEFNGETSYDSYYNHPGIAITASTGDDGYGRSFPAPNEMVWKSSTVEMSTIPTSFTPPLD